MSRIHSYTSVVPPLAWTLLSGPERMDAPLSAVSLTDAIVRYAPETIAESILAFRGTCLRQGPEQSWDDWRAQWRQGFRFLTLEMTVVEDGLWGGTTLSGNASAAQALALWEFLLTRHTGIWMQDKHFIMHTPASFAEQYINLAASQPPRSPQETTLAYLR